MDRCKGSVDKPEVNALAAGLRCHTQHHMQSLVKNAAMGNNEIPGWLAF